MIFKVFDFVGIPEIPLCFSAFISFYLNTLINKGFKLFIEIEKIKKSKD